MAFANTRVKDGDDIWGRERIVFRDITISGTYTAGGYTIDARDVGLRFYKGVEVSGGDVSQLTYFPFIDFGTSPLDVQTTCKLRFATASGTEATGTLSPAINLRLCFIGQ
jgi:hypothetical protein